MSSDRRQEKQARRKSKAKQKQARQSGTSGAEAMHIREGIKNSIAECLIDNSNANQGMRIIMITKMSGLNIVIIGSFIIDTYCLGIKDCFLKAGTVEQYKNQREIRPFEKIKPEDAKKIIHDTVEWSRSIGFEPHKDFKKAFKIFADIDENDSKIKIEFGREGKPFYIAGPFDSPAKCKKIISTLKKNCGRESEDFNFMMPNAEHMNFDEEEGRWEGSENL